MVTYVLSLCLVGALILGAALLPHWLGLGREIASLRVRRAALQKLASRFNFRLAKRKHDLLAAVGATTRAEDRRRELLHDRRMVHALTEAAVRIVEPERCRPGSSVWMARVVNRLSDSMAPKAGGGFYFDKCWSRPQAVLVLAPGLAEARVLVERAYPDSLGFSLVSIDRAPRHLAALVERDAAGDEQDPKVAA